MKKLALLLSVGILLSACSDPNTSQPAKLSSANQAIKLTPGLEDCAMYDFKVDLNSPRDIYIVRCSGKSITTVNQEVPSGKATRMQSTVIIDGQEYIKKDTATNVKEDSLER